MSARRFLNFGLLSRRPIPRLSRLSHRVGQCAPNRENVRGAFEIGLVDSCRFTKWNGNPVGAKRLDRPF
jgi:hypothetical protein